MIAIAQIKTSTKNKELVTQLTRKFASGAENVIARIAIAYSLTSVISFHCTLPWCVLTTASRIRTKTFLATSRCTLMMVWSV